MKFEKQSIKSQKIIVDGNEFVSCRFEDCELAFYGFAPFNFESCEFVSSPFGFAGPAGRALEILQVLYQPHTGFQKLVENTLNEIRSGKPIDVVIH